MSEQGAQPSGATLLRWAVARPSGQADVDWSHYFRRCLEWKAEL